jgi:hypothetical protein
MGAQGLPVGIRLRTGSVMRLARLAAAGFVAMTRSRAPARVREIRTAISRLKAGLMALAMVALAGCGHASSSTTTQPGDRSSTVTQRATAHAFYPPPVTSDCSTSLHAAEHQAGIPELRGPAKGGEVVALVFHALPLTAMQETKIVLRVTGHGPLRVTGMNEAGDAAEISGPSAHLGGDWGTFVIFPKPGCWRLHIERDDVSGDVFLPVIG